MLLGLATLALAAPADPAAVEATALELAKDIGTDATPEARLIEWRGGTVARVGWTWRGLPVDDDPGIASFGNHGTLRHHQLRAPKLPADPTPTLSEGDARRLGADAIGHLGRGALWEPRATLAVRDGRLAWRVDASTSEPPATWRTWIDAHTGQPFGTTPTSWTGRAEVFPTNPLTSEPVEVDLQGLLDGGTLSGTYTRVSSCDEWLIEEGLFGATDCLSWSAHALADADGDFVFAPDPASFHDPQAEVQVYHHLDLAADWYATELGFDLGRPIEAYVNWEMANAFYGDFDGDELGDVSFGQTPDDGVDFAYDADVVYHELTHAVIDEVSGIGTIWADDYGMRWTPGALHEGGADVMSMVLQGDSDLGEYAGSGFGDAPIRDLDADRRCPDALAGEVHYDGELLGALGWNLIEDPAVGPDATAHLLYGAMATWTTTTTWPQTAAGLLDSADALRDAGAIDDATHAAIAGHLEATGMAECGRVRDLRDDERIGLYVVNPGLQGDWTRFPAGVQLRVEVPPNRLGVVDLELASREDGMGWAVLTREGEPVEHEVTALPGVGLAVAEPRTWDREHTGVGTDMGAFLLPPGEWYLALASVNDGTLPPYDFTWGAVRVGFRVVPGERSTEERPGGCGCTSGAGVGWLALLALPWIRRRRP